MAGPLTQYLNGIEKNEFDSNDKVWADAFILDWEGDFDTLPYIIPSRIAFRQIKTKLMYHRCKEYFKFEDVHVVKFSNLYKYELEELLDEDYSDQESIYTKDLDKDNTIGFIQFHDYVVAPMKNLWLHELRISKLWFPVALAKAAIYHGCVRLLDYLVKYNGVDLALLSELEDDGPSMDVVAENGHLNMLKYLHKAGFKCTTDAMDQAAEKGYLDILEYLHKAGFESFNAFEKAAENGHLDIVKWLHENTTQECYSRLVEDVISNGHIEVFKYLQTHFDLKLSQSAMVMAVEKDNLELVKLLREQYHLICCQNSMEKAVRRGHLPVVQYLYENREEEFLAINDVPAYYGHANVMKYLFGKCLMQFSKEAMDRAASAGYVEAVEFLHTNFTEGCTEKAMDNAAKNGQFEIVKFLHENRTEGCTTKAMDQAAANGHIDIVKYLHENRTEGCTTDAKYQATKNGHLEVVKYLHENHIEG
ncbi:hypothetical protein THRCLA_08091 [Thraustotheca clavata]|uniref:Uncharacterized protein n=1 Tax=Thraustotheca clavata TaxID=74557 RepID=A0A1V9Z9Y3_9STRA|nr:hypothetical protein THRCLA_08091 [Thraustotheca clavata]